MSYIKESLSKGEQVYQIFKHHWLVELSILINFALAVLTVGIWLIPAIIIFLGWKHTEQGVTNKRVISKHGIISRKTEELRLNAIEAIFIDQSILGRLLGYGTVTITGRGQEDVVLKWMTDPLRVKREIESIEYGEIREIAPEKDSIPLSERSPSMPHESGGEKKKRYGLTIGFAAVFFIILLVAIGSNHNNQPASQSANIAQTAAKPGPSEQPSPVQEHPAPEQAKPTVAVESSVALYQQQADETQRKVWSSDWGNGIYAFLTEDACQDADFATQGYAYFAISTIPESRLKKQDQAFFVENGRAVTVMGCWFKKEGGLVHLKMKRKSDGKIWEQDHDLNDGKWAQSIAAK